MRGLLISLEGAAIATMLASCGLGGFPDYSELPPDYSARYATVTVVTSSDREKRVIVPEACLTPDQVSDAEMGPLRIAPGCANNWNTLQSVERKQDVLKGRKMDKAPAVTVSRPAQRYLDSRGDPGALGGAAESIPTGSADAGTAFGDASGSSSGRY